MTVSTASVNRNTPKSYLTLSAVGEVEPDHSGAPTDELAPPEAVVRDERDPYIWTEAELRLAWGDR